MSRSTAHQPLADVREMYEVHTMLRRELRLGSTLIPQVVVGDTERARAVGDHIELMLQLLHGHHSAEDEHVWPKLLERVPGELSPIVHTMETQHQIISTLQEELLAALVLWREKASAEARDAVANALNRLFAELVEHLGLEEKRVVPLIAQHITAAEWAAVAQASGSHLPQDQMPLLFGMLMYEADPEIIQLTVDNLPLEIRPVIRDMASSSYAAYSEGLCGTQTPPRSKG